MPNLTRITISTETQTETAPPASPHFDDEATLLTARPVVPISDAVNLGTVHSYLVTTAIIVAAALVGAAGAFTVDYIRNDRPAEAASIVQPSAPATDSSGSQMPEIPETPETNEPQSSAAIPANVSAASAENQIETPSAPETQETQLTTSNKADQKKSNGNDLDGGRRKIFEKRSEQLGPQRREKTPSPIIPTKNAERPRDAGRIREIFEGPGPF